MHKQFIEALATAGVLVVTNVHTHYCRDAYGNPIIGCKGHHTAKVKACHIDEARNVCEQFNSGCQSASVYM